MIDSKKVESLITDFNVSVIRAKGSETLEKAVEKIMEARRCIEELEKIIQDMKQTEHNLTEDLYKLEPWRK